MNVETKIVNFVSKKLQTSIYLNDCLNSSRFCQKRGNLLFLFICKADKKIAAKLKKLDHNNELIKNLK